MASIIDGKAFAANLLSRVAEQVTQLKTEHDITPGLAVVLVGEDPASQVYVRNKGRQTREAGMNSFEHRLDQHTPEHELIQLIQQLNQDTAVHGILVQLPLPNQIDEVAVINAIAPDKDVDGFHLLNVGKLAVGDKGIIPCTPLGCLMLLRDSIGDLSGLHAVVIGRSNIVGKPMAALLLQNNCTVTLTHSRTRNLPEVCAQADIVVAAVGQPNMVKAGWIKAGATVIDVGMNRITRENGKTKLVGDVDFDEVVNKAAAITPVPGGVGPMTIACLLHNTLQQCKVIHGVA